LEGQELSEPTMEEEKKALQKLNNNKSPGRDTIPSELIKSGGDSLIKCIYELIRKIWMQKELPDEWKRSIICPIHETFWNVQITGAYIQHTKLCSTLFMHTYSHTLKQKLDHTSMVSDQANQQPMPYLSYSGF
jgi:hypothetical protein